MYVRQIFWGCRPPKYLTDIHPSNILDVLTPQVFAGHTSVKYFGGVDRQMFGGSKQYLTDVCQFGGSILHQIFGGSIFWGVYTPKFDGCMSVFDYTPKYLTDVCPSNILGGLHPPNI